MDIDQMDEATVTILEGAMTDGQLNGEYTYIDYTGERFSGHLKMGVPDGWGRKIRQNGEYMEGEFKNGVFVTGKYRWTKNGVFSQGEILEGAIWEGQGRKIVNGVEMIGQFKNGVLNGIGKMTFPKGKSVEGEFRDGQIWKGYGTVYIEQRELEGQFVEGVPEGPVIAYHSDGVLAFRGTFKNGRPWEGFGDWKRDKITEIGTFRGGLLQNRGMRTVGDRRFIGSFQDGKLNGKGAIVGPRKHILIGEFKNDVLITGKRLTDWRLEQGTFSGDKLQGRGSISYISCFRINGELKANLPQELDNWIEELRDLDGQLEEVLEMLSVGDGSTVIEGEFLDGVLDGQGRQSMCGTVSVGHFTAGKLHGRGCRTYPDGRVEKGVFLEDVLVQIPPSGHHSFSQRLTLENGSIVEGQWPTGYAILTRGAGFQEEGFFDRGELIDGKIKIQITSSASVIVGYKDGLPSPDFSFYNSNYRLDAKVLNGRVVKIINLTDGAGVPLEAEVLFGSKSTRSAFVTENGAYMKGSVSSGNPQKGHYYDFTGAARNGRYAEKTMTDGQVDWEGFHLTFNGKKLKHITHPQYKEKKIEKLNSSATEADENPEFLIMGSQKNGQLEGRALIAGMTWFEEGEFCRGVPHGMFKEFSPWHFTQAFYQKGRQTGPGFGISENFEVYFGNFTNYGDYTGIARFGFRVEEGQFVNWNLHGRGKVSFYGGSIEGVFAKGKIVELKRVTDENGFSVEAALAKGDEDGVRLVVRPNATLVRGIFKNGTLEKSLWETTEHGLKMSTVKTKTGEDKTQLEGPNGLVEWGDFSESLVLHGGGYRQWTEGVADRGVFSDGVLKLREVINFAERNVN